MRMDCEYGVSASFAFIHFLLKRTEDVIPRSRGSSTSWAISVEIGQAQIPHSIKLE